MAAGTTTGPTATATAPAAAPVVTNTQASGLTENVAAALCYILGLITGILFLVLAPYNQNRTIRFHAFQSIFFHVGMIIASIGFTVVTMILGALPGIGWLVHILALLGWLAIWFGALAGWIFLMYKAYNNEKFVLPVVGPLAEKQA